MKGGDYVRKAEVKMKQSENPLGAVYANRETCQIPAGVCKTRNTPEHPGTSMSDMSKISFS